MKKILKSFNFFYVSKLYYWTKKKRFYNCIEFYQLTATFQLFVLVLSAGNLGT